tara:strand:- start:1827 stop:2234 length:408 start_codon:yes stop_codon:yes gene_type:complete
LSFFVWASYYKLEPIERFEKFPYKAQSPLSVKLKEFKNEANIWEEVEAISELAKTSKTRTIGQLLYDLVPLFASPNFFNSNWMFDIMNEYHWIKNWNISPGNLDDVSAFRLDCWTIIDNEMNKIEEEERKKNGQS